MPCIGNLCLQASACPPTERNHTGRRVMWQLPLVLVVKGWVFSGQRVYFEFPHWNNIALCQDFYSNALYALSKTVKRSPEPILTSAKHKLLIARLFRSLLFLTLRVWQETCCCIRSGIQSHGNFQRKHFLFLIPFFFFFLSVRKSQYGRNQNILQNCLSLWMSSAETRQFSQGNFLCFPSWLTCSPPACLKGSCQAQSLAAWAKSLRVSYSAMGCLLWVRREGGQWG